MSNDFRRLKEEADIRSVVDYCGIQKGRRIGGAQFVVCPNPEHEDTHPTNAYYRDGWNTIFCTTCNKNMGPIDIIMWTMGYTYGQAADALWELEGRPDWYYEDRNHQGEKKFSISIREMEFLGIKIPTSIYVPVRFTRNREYPQEQITKGYLYQFQGDGYMLVRQERTTWEDYLSQKQLEKLVLLKSKKMIDELDRIERAFGKKDLFPETREKIEEILRRLRERGNTLYE